MERSGLSRLLPILLVLIVIGVIIAAVVSISRGLFNNNAANEQQNSQARSNLLNLDVDRSVRLTVRGPLVADENFRSYTITISPTERKLVTYKGYQTQQIAESTLSNTSKAYDEFVHALDKANLTKGAPFTGDKDSQTGVCAIGRVYDFSLLAADNTVEHLWTSTCGGSPGSLVANPEQLINLFQVQIPESSKLTSSVSLS